jgi:hypothetical protein
LVQEELTQRAQARDPVKLAVIISTILVIITALIGVLLGRMASNKTEMAAALQAKWDKIQVQQSKSGATDTKALRSTAEDYLTFNKTRPLYAPQLALIKELIPDSIQLSAIRFSQVTETVAPSALPTAGLSEAKAARMAKPKTIERQSLGLEGTTAGARPEIEVDLFIKSLRAHPVFGNQVSDVRLRSITRSGGAAGVPSVTFVIDCAFKEAK